MFFYLICFVAGCKQYNWKAPAILATAGVIYGIAWLTYMDVRTEAWPTIVPAIAVPAYVFGFAAWGAGRGCAHLFKRWRVKAPTTNPLS